MHIVTRARTERAPPNQALELNVSASGSLMLVMNLAAMTAVRTPRPTVGKLRDEVVNALALPSGQERLAKFPESAERHPRMGIILQHAADQSGRYRPVESRASGESPRP